MKHGSVPKGGAVLSRAIGQHPEMKSRARELAGMIEEVIREVEALSPEERERMLWERYPALAEEMQETKTRTRDLPPLEDAEKGVVMRFAPNPNGPLHLGHARAAVLNDAYVRRYNGRFILRIEDTDPKRVDTAAYEMIREDLQWLGIKVDEIVYQSDRLELYYRHCQRLMEMGGAYVCTCEGEYFKRLKLLRRACPCRGRSPEENLSLWGKMLDGEFAEGTATVRIKTDLEDPDPAMRDFPAFRIVDHPPHPLKQDARVFPLMNFSVAIDDHLLGITHVIRGKDHIANTERQRYIFEYFGWKPPHYRHYGRMSIEGVILSTSQMNRGIRDGLFSGWDDISLGTLRAIARRGIEAEAVRGAILEIGIGETDISFSWENLYAKNREIVDPRANRYFFVPDPLKVRVVGASARLATPLLHPAHPERGRRELQFSGVVLIPKKDAAEGFFRLKDLFNVRLSLDGGEWLAHYAGDSLSEARAAKAPIIQWLPEGCMLPCILHTTEGDQRGYCEPGVKSETGRVVQFERIGFARVERITPEGIEACFAHR